MRDAGVLECMNDPQSFYTVPVLVHLLQVQNKLRITIWTLP